MIKVHKHQRGVYSVEFVLVAGFLFLLLFSVLEIGKVMYFFSTANESTRRAARLAAVCDKGAPQIKATITNRLNFLTEDSIEITYIKKGIPDNTCEKDNCELIRVELDRDNAVYTSSIVPISVKLPAFSTTIPRESMDSSFNADCS